MKNTAKNMRAGLAITSISLIFLHGCDSSDGTRMFTGNSFSPSTASSESSSSVPTTSLDCESIAESAVGVYDASHYGSNGEKLSTQWLFIDVERHTSLYVDQNSEPGQIARNCYSGGEVDGRNYQINGYYGTFVSDGSCVLHTQVSATGHLNLRINEGTGVVSIKAYEPSADETNESYVENWVVEADEFVNGFQGPYSLKAGKVASPTIADIQSQLCDDSVDGYYWPKVRSAENNYVED